MIGLHMDAYSHTKDFLTAISEIIYMLCGDGTAPYLFIPSVVATLKSLFLASVYIFLLFEYDGSRLLDFLFLFAIVKQS